MLFSNWLANHTKNQPKTHLRSFAILFVFLFLFTFQFTFQNIPQKVMASSQRQYTEVVINEFLPTPTSPGIEWIELYNPTDTLLDISGYMLDDIPNGGSSPYKFPAGTVIQPKSYLLVTKNESGITLNTDGDSVRLLNPIGEEIDNYTYTSSNYDVSYGRMPDGGILWTTYTYPTPGAPNGVVPQPSDLQRKILLAEVYYNPYSNRNDEFVMLYNPTTYTIDISLWRISNNKTSCIIPDGFHIGAKSAIYITKNATSFLSDMGFYPSLESTDSTPKVNNTQGTWPTFANSKGVVLLTDKYGNIIDCLVYGSEIYNGSGWLGGPAPALPSGQVQKRNKSELTGEYIDTNTSSDWTSLRQYVVGQSDFPQPSYTYTGEIVPFISPENAFDAIANELDNAKSTIYLNLYQFDNWFLAEKIFSAQLNRSVKVKALFEGGPVGWNFTNEPESVYLEKKGAYKGAYTEKLIASRIVAYGGEVRFLTTNGTAGIKDRYTYDHAKYAIIDNKTLILGSENWKDTGIPKLSSYGNRGWGIIVRNEEVAEYFVKVFESDFNPLMADSFPFTPSHIKYGNPPSYFRPETEVMQGKYKPLQSLTLKTITGTFKVTPVLSPDHTLYEHSSLIGAINNAKKEIVIELAQLDMDWRPRKGESVPNLYLEALIQAAKRGVKVRIILDPTFSSEASPDIDNYDLASYINYLAQTQKLDMKAKLVYLQGTEKIHNKGMIIDDYLTLVSSLNWGRGSVTSNREVGVLIENIELASYYKIAFEYDWNQTSFNVDENAHNDTLKEEKSQLAQIATCLIMLMPVVIIAVMLIVFIIKKREDDRTSLQRTEVTKHTVTTHTTKKQIAPSTHTDTSSHTITQPQASINPNITQPHCGQSTPYPNTLYSNQPPPPTDYSERSTTISQVTYPYLPPTSEALKSIQSNATQENEKEKREESRRKASELIGLAKATIIEKANRGIDVSSADAQLSVANKFMINGDYQNASKMAVKAMSLAMEAERRASAHAQTKNIQAKESEETKEKIIEKKKIEVKKPYLTEPDEDFGEEEIPETSKDEETSIQKMLLQIKKAKDAIHKLRVSGGNTDQAEKILALAESFAKDGNTDKAIKYAQKAENIASQIQIEKEIEIKEEKKEEIPSLTKIDKKDKDKRADGKRTCPKCNMELQQNWIGCPYCKTRLDISNKDEIRTRLESTKSMLSLMEKLGEDVSDARSKLNLAESFLRLGENDKALDYIIKAETYLNEKNSRGV